MSASEFAAARRIGKTGRKQRRGGRRSIPTKIRTIKDAARAEVSADAHPFHIARSGDELVHLEIVADVSAATTPFGVKFVRNQTDKRSKYQCPSHSRLAAGRTGPGKEWNDRASTGTAGEVGRRPARRLQPS